MAKSAGSLPVVQFRPVVEADLDRLEAWLAQPHVRAWWGDPAAEIRMIAGMLSDQAAACWIAQDGSGADFGYLQAYVVDRGDSRTRTAWAALRSGAVGLDCFIGDPGRLGRGLGAGMVASMVACLAEAPMDPHQSYVFMDPDPQNEGAIRSYRRAGLTPVGQITMVEGTVALLVQSLPSPAVKARRSGLAEPCSSCPRSELAHDRSQIIAI